MRRKLSTNIHKLLYDVKWFNIVWHLPAKNKFDFWWLMRKRKWTCTRQERVTAHINMMSPFEKTVNDLTVFTHYFNSLRWRTTMFSVATQSVVAKEGEPTLPMPAANIHCWCLPADYCGSYYALLENRHTHRPYSDSSPIMKEKCRDSRAY